MTEIYCFPVSLGVSIKCGILKTNFWKAIQLVPITKIFLKKILMISEILRSEYKNTASTTANVIETANAINISMVYSPRVKTLLIIYNNRPNSTITYINY